jgi:hypothetical protein
MLGFVLNLKENFRGMARFVPTSFFCPATRDCPGMKVLDTCHGRVLLQAAKNESLVVWDPVTEREWKIPKVPVFALGFNVAVLCATAGCDHLDYHGSHFSVAFVGSDDHGIAFACTYSSEAGAWSQRVHIQEPVFVNDRPGVLVGNTVYFTCDPHISFKIIGYNIVAQELMVVWPPSQHEDYCCTVIFKAEDGTLGFAGVQNGRLYLWSTKPGPDEDVEWVQHRVRASSPGRLKRTKSCWRPSPYKLLLHYPIPTHRLRAAVLVLLSPTTGRRPSLDRRWQAR